MGMFSYMCRISGEQIRSDLDGSDDCKNVVRLYYLKNGKVVEEMHGLYNGYGAVEPEYQTFHCIYDENGNPTNVLDKNKEHDSNMELWLSEDWGDMVTVHFNNSKSDGFCAVLEGYVGNKYSPTKISEDDPNQGWDTSSEDDDWDEDNED